jgi:hypothetical protein
MSFCFLFHHTEKINYVFSIVWKATLFSRHIFNKNICLLQKPKFCHWKQIKTLLTKYSSVKRATRQMYDQCIRIQGGRAFCFNTFTNTIFVYFSLYGLDLLEPKTTKKTSTQQQQKRFVCFFLSLLSIRTISGGSIFCRTTDGFECFVTTGCLLVAETSKCVLWILIENVENPLGKMNIIFSVDIDLFLLFQCSF